MRGDMNVSRVVGVKVERGVMGGEVEVVVGKVELKGMGVVWGVGVGIE